MRLGITHLQLDSLAHFAVNYDGIHNTIWLIIHIIAFVWYAPENHSDERCMQNCRNSVTIWRQMHKIYEYLIVSWIYNMWKWWWHASTHMTWIQLDEDNFAHVIKYGTGRFLRYQHFRKVKMLFSSIAIEWCVSWGFFATYALCYFAHFQWARYDYFTNSLMTSTQCKNLC